MAAAVFLLASAVIWLVFVLYDHYRQGCQDELPEEFVMNFDVSNNAIASLR